MVPYVYSPENGGTFLTYEDRESVNLKIDYVMEHELGGVFFWELSGDVEDPNSPDALVFWRPIGLWLRYNRRECKIFCGTGFQSVNKRGQDGRVYSW